MVWELGRTGELLLRWVASRSRVQRTGSATAWGHLPWRSWSRVSHLHVEKKKDLTPPKGV